MLRPTVAWKSPVTLVPFSGVQYLDFVFDLDATSRLTLGFIERRDPTTRRADGSELLRFIPLTGDEQEDERRAGGIGPDDDHYEISKIKALEPFLGKWVPVPFLRVRPGRGRFGETEYDHGPTNWARVCVLPAEETVDGHRTTHRAVLAIDTDLGERVEGRPYLQPSFRDAEDEQEFALASRADDVGWFLAWPDKAAFDGQDPQAWVDGWLDELYRELRQAQRPGRPLREEDFQHRFEHWARYLTFLRLLDDALHPPRLKLLDTVSAERRHAPVQVDLVLDIGNSRTCGILIETHPDDPVDLNNSYVLQLRDLSDPKRIYTEPFESRVEFAQGSFGKDHFSRRSGRSRAFFWPSLVRIGPEAMRMVGEAQGTEVTTGMSSPKRYLWSVEPVNQEWRFQERDYSASGEEPAIARAARRFLTESGEVIRQLMAERAFRNRQPAIRSRFSRSSLYGFMLAEVLVQALVQINDPGERAGRRQGDLPRRLRQIIVTLPPATPLAEQRIMRSRAEGAVKLVFDLMGWTQNQRLGFGEPRITIRWDEASCAHLVWLYTEITQKFSGQPRDFVRLMGRERPCVDRAGHAPAPNTRAEPALRIASIDIGGGTTDLMITTYYVVENRALRPTQNFREGFKIAGDDILEAIVARVIIPAFERSLKDAGVAQPGNLLKELFGGDRANMREQQKLLRRLFVLRVFVPTALALLHALEDAVEGFALDPTRTLPLSHFLGLDVEQAAKTTLGALVGERIAGYVEDAARQAGARDLRLLDTPIDVDLRMLDEVVRVTLRSAMGHLSEVIHELDCDIVLLTGRPSRLPSVADALVESLAVMPDRVVPMHHYRAGIWYPFRGRDNVRIADPKTTAVVGGMLCSLAESQIQNFLLESSRLMLRSTARFIGEMEISGQILDERLIFRDLDLDQKASQAPASAAVRLFAPMQIGFRQLPLERWTATPLYRLEATNPQAFARMQRPFTVTLERKDVDQDLDENATDEQKLRAEAAREEFAVTEVTDGRGDQVKTSDVALRLQTLGRLDAYWLDSGILPLI